MFTHTLLDQFKDTNNAIRAFFAEGENDYLAAELTREKVNKRLKKDKKEIIKEERDVQKKQQSEWDKMNNQSFPASDPVARY